MDLQSWFLTILAFVIAVAGVVALTSWHRVNHNRHVSQQDLHRHFPVHSNLRTQIQTDLDHRWELRKERWVQTVFLAAFVLLAFFVTLIFLVAEFGELKPEAAGPTLRAPGEQQTVVLSAPALERLLRDRLPSETIAAQHQREFIAALNRIAEGQQRDAAVAAYDVAWLGMIMVIFGFGGVLVGLRFFRDRPGLRAALLISGATLFSVGSLVTVGSVFGGVTFFKAEGTVFSSPATNPMPGDNTATGWPPNSTSCHGDAVRIFQVLEDPITTDIAALDHPDRQFQTRVWAALQHLKAKHHDRHLAGIALIGSADKRPLTERTAQFYGSNEGLAQARARRVRAALMEYAKDTNAGLPPIALMPPSGPTILGAHLDARGMAADRAVVMCAVWR